MLARDRKRKIVLFYPKLHGEGIEEEADFPPLALLAAASMIDRSRYDVRVVDLRFDNDLERNADELLGGCVCAGVSALSGHQIQNGLDAARLVRRKAPDVPVVWGGWHPTLFAEQTAAHPLVDVVVRGQGEITFPELLESLQNGRDLETVKGLTFRRNGSVVSTEDRPLTDINEFPEIPYDLVDVNRYLSPNGNGGEKFIYYSSSVGCPHRCGFCVISLVYKRRWFALPPERVVNEIESLVKRYGIRIIQFADSEFFINKRRVLEICRLMVERRLGIRWRALLRSEMLSRYSEEELDLLRDSGCDQLIFGVETGSQRVSDIIHKDNRVEDALESAKRCRQMGVEGHYAFVFGFPGETREDMLASFDLIAKLKEIDPHCLIPMYFYHPDPSTPLYEKAEKMGLTPPQDLEAWGRVDYNIKEAWAPWITDKYADLVKRAVVFYLPAAYPADITRGTLTHMKSKMERGRKKYLFRLLHHLAKIRVKHRYYGFPIEWRMYNLFHRHKYR
ncbi:MAG: hypothetical protein DRP79_01730 [Planctomycetota bacterium]|nr:MAG: hypothetical protein DRP79_01730 [Planctomycetota bacterium]